MSFSRWGFLGFPFIWRVYGHTVSSKCKVGAKLVFARVPKARRAKTSFAPTENPRDPAQREVTRRRPPKSAAGGSLGRRLTGARDALIVRPLMRSQGPQHS